MTKQIAIIDPFIKSPSVHCFNHLIDILKLRATYHLPSLMGNESIHREKERTYAYIVLGSASHVGQNLSWHSPLADILLSELNVGKPILGCCFGHQLVCHALGSKIDFVFENQERLSGVRNIKITDDHWFLKKGEMYKLPVTHRQIVKSLGPELIPLAQDYSFDIVAHKSLPFLGTQAHPEASNFFCQNEIKNLSDSDMALAQSDGRRFIRQFFQYFNLV